jgi:hypothetical protein
MLLFFRIHSERLSFGELFREDHFFIFFAIYGPMIYTAPYVMLLMQANSLQGQVGGGFDPANRDFFGPCEMAPSR